MSFPWVNISTPFSEMSDDGFEIIVVGSGYGGGVAASRLARAGRDVAVLERGREIAPGDYPRDPETAMQEFQVSLSETGAKLGDKPDGLYDLRINKDMNVLIGCGLGGTSLINANVAIEADPRVFKTWPKEFRNDPTILDEYYKRARRMLGSQPYPEGKTPPKMAALQKVAEGLGAPFCRPDINVSFKDGHNAAGLYQAACTDCGDCVSGCNYGAKNTVLMNYLPDAKRHKAKIFTGAQVVSLSREKDVWLVHTTAPDGSDPRTLTAKFVILAAGTLGTNEILLKSRSDKLKFSEHLGKHFSGNGDVWAFGYNANIPAPPDDVIRLDDRAPIYGIGAGVHDVTHGPTAKEDEPFKPGPCITGLVDLNNDTLEKSLIIEEGAMPGALAAGYAAGFPMMDALLGDVFRFGDTVERLNDAATLGKTIEADPLSLADTAYSGPLSRTMPFLIMSHDSSAGSLAIQKDQVTVIWDGAGEDAAIVHDEAVIRAACDAIRAEYLPNPLWQDELGRRLVTVHPLGGCAMADTVEEGVINERGQVFDPEGSLHAGLYVCDGAVMPRGLGVNPHLTITAVAERTIELLAEDQDWAIDWSELDPIEPLETVEPQMPDILEAMDKLIAGLQQIKTAIDNQMWELAKPMVLGLWRQIYDVYEQAPSRLKRAFPLPDPKTFIDYLGDPISLRTIVGEILGQALATLEPARDLLKENKWQELLALVENDFGDFSPSVSFFETMKGFVSDIGLHDKPMPTDPFAVAAESELACVLKGDVRADKVRTAVTPPDGVAEIRNATLYSEFLEGTFALEDGKFGFLMPDDDQIECWKMTYDGRLVETDTRKPRRFRFHGYKTLKLREGSHWYRDLTELRVEITADDDERKPVARGMLHVGFEDLIKQARDLTFDYDDLLVVAVRVYKKVRKTALNNKSGLPKLFENKKFRAKCVKTAVLAANYGAPELGAKTGLEDLYRGKVFLRMGGLVMRAYGGIYSYMSNFPASEAGDSLPFPDDLGTPEYHYPEPEAGKYVKLTRFRDTTRPKNERKGPVILAGGFGTRASSFATPTVDTNLVQLMVKDGFDVWLFDYRGSGDIEASLSPFNLDDVALKDWPAAIDLVTDITCTKEVQVLVHCVGSLTLFMAVLAGETRVRSIISSQLGPHAITNWFNYAKGDSRTANYIAHGMPKELWGLVDMMPLGDELKSLAKKGMSVVDPRSPRADLATELDHAIDGALWKVPSFAPIPCNSPTCHRINFIFGPSYRHEQLNQATHNAIAHMFGPVSTTPFAHLARIFREGQAVSADGRVNYLDNPGALSMPVHFIAGARNQEMLPEASLRTLKWLTRNNTNPTDGPYTRHVFPDYGHMDCFIGQTASDDIFPHLLKILNETC